MTPALKAMVEAMAAELVRQSDQDFGAGSAERDSWSEPPERYVRLNGRFDLEKVARAGLAAIRTPGLEVEAGVKAADDACNPFLGTEDEGVPADPEDARVAWTYCIDAILNP